MNKREEILNSLPSEEELLQMAKDKLKTDMLNQKIQEALQEELRLLEIEYNQKRQEVHKKYEEVVSVVGDSPELESIVEE